MTPTRLEQWLSEVQDRFNFGDVTTTDDSPANSCIGISWYIVIHQDEYHLHGVTALRYFRAPSAIIVINERISPALF
jgi:hypothetical protein